MSSLLCLGRHTVTGLLATAGLTFRDWSASFRLFSQQRFAASAMFHGMRSRGLETLPREAPLARVVAGTRNAANCPCPSGANQPLPIASPRNALFIACAASLGTQPGP
jgi:hypothetical protein